jgi:hypothetical protein
MKPGTAWLLALLAIAAPPAPAAPPDERPFPVDRTQILSDEKVVYTVEGRIRIPKGVEITCQKEVHVKAKGSGPAVIEVEGSLKIRGVATREVILEGVTVEPCAEFASIRIDSTWFRNGGGVKTPAGKAVKGDLFLELCDLSKGASYDVRFHTGEVRLSSICTDGPTVIRTEPPPGSKAGSVRVFLRGSGSGGKCTNHTARIGFGGGLEIDGGDDVTVQLSRIGGSLCSVRNWGQRMIFDGNKVNSTKLAFGHQTAGQFQRAQCAKLDVYSDEVTVDAPPSDKLKDTFVMDRCWFKGATDPKQILASLIKDGADDPSKNGTRVVLPKVEDRPHELAGPVDR